MSLYHPNKGISSSPRVLLKSGSAKAAMGGKENETLETLTGLIKLGRVTWVKVAPRGRHLDSQDLGAHRSWL